MTPQASARSRDEWRALAAQLSPPSGIYIDGAFEEAASARTFPSTDPSTGETIVDVAEGDAADVGRAVASGRRAFDAGDWAETEPQERKAVLFRLAELVAERREELALMDSLNTGKLVAEALSSDMTDAVNVMRWYGEALDKIYGEVAPTGPRDVALVTREPLGVVACVVPWNFPLSLAVWKLAPALAAGNSVVLKPAEQSPLSVLRLAELAIQAGLPPGVLNVVPGYGETAGRALGLHPDVDVVAFTGSTEVGKLFLQYSGQSNMKQVWLECGGKSPNVVFADVADLDRAAKLAARGIFYNQGEVCTASSRLIVQREIKDELLERLLDHAGHFKPGDPLDPESTMGALVSESHTDRVMKYIDQGRKEGQLVCGGERPGRTFVEPTILDEVDPDGKLANEEVFGPVLAVLPVEGEEAMIELANATRYGLAASVWTRDVSRAHRVARRLRAGTVSVNTVDALSPTTPFGGFRESGIGRDLSLHAFDKYTGLKTTWISLTDGDD